MYIHVTQALEEWASSAGLPLGIVWGAPKFASQGDAAFSCFVFAKERGLSPAEIAKEYAESLAKHSHQFVSSVSADGPYVNVVLRASEVVDRIVRDILDNPSYFGNTKEGKGKRVLIEYPSQNTHKEFHIGHLRNVCIGNAIVGVYKKAGYDIVPINYINDFGAHVSKCLWGIVHLYGGVVPDSGVQKWLGEVYAKTTEYVREHEEVKTELQEMLVKLEARDSSVWPLFEKTRGESLRGFEAIMQELGVVHTKVFLESEVKDRGQQKVDELLASGIATVGEGEAIIADLSKHGLDIALLRKSTGAGLYMTSDLALAEKKFAEFQVGESINITGTEQNFYFKQLFKVLELSGFEHKMTHVGYGLVNLPDGKMSSRAGNVILYETLRDEIYERMLSEVGSRHEDWSREKIASQAWVLAQAVLKFTMQKHEAAKNVTFHMEEAVSFDGYSAPYILYTLSRTYSISRKAAEAGITDTLPEDALFGADEEKALALLLGEYEAVLAKARSVYNPSPLCVYAYDLSKAFTAFYGACHIVDSDHLAQSSARLALTVATRMVLEDVLGVLSIEVVKEM